MVRVILVAGLLSVPLLAVGPPQQSAAAGAAFEIVSIKPGFPEGADVRGFSAGAGYCGLSRFTPAGNLVRLGKVTPCMLIRMAYNVTEMQVQGLPEWADQLKASAWYEVEARAEAGAVLTIDQGRERLRSMLADRFKLQFHREPRLAPVYALTVDPSGHKLRTDVTCPESKVPFQTRFGPSMTLTSCKGEMSIPQLIVALNREVDRPVVDRTNLAGRYSFTLDWAPDPAAAGGAPSIFTAVREQLGLRLEPANEPVDAIVIDRVEPPTPN
jgi:uncharacterized protein (TIGR03435 family)